MEIEVEATASIDISDVLEFIRNHTDASDKMRIQSQIDTISTGQSVNLRTLGDDHRFGLCKQIFNSTKTESEIEGFLKGG